ncbi:MFS transporter [Isosphaeraceae bacterium EP7]
MRMSIVPSRTTDAPVLRAKTTGDRFLKALIFASAGLTGLSIAMYGGLASWVSEDLDLRHVHSGLAQAAFFAGNLLAVWLMGRALRANPSPGRLWLMALSFTAMGSLATGTPSFALLVFGRFVAGMGLSSTTLALTALIVERWPAERTRMLNLMHACTATAAALALGGGRSLAEGLGGWMPVFWLCALAGGLTAVGLRFVDLSPVEEVSDEETGFAEEFDADRPPVSLARIIGIMGAYVAIEQALTVFLPALAETALNLSPARASLAGAVMWAGVIVGRLGSAALRTLPERPTLIFGSLGMGASVLLAMVQTEWWTMAPLIFAAGVFGGPLIPTGYGLASRSRSVSRPLAISLCQVGTGLGGLAGPTFVGLAGDGWGLQAGLTCVALTALVAGLGLALPAQLASTGEDDDAVTSPSLNLAEAA